MLSITNYNNTKIHKFLIDWKLELFVIPTNQNISIHFFEKACWIVKLYNFKCFTSPIKLQTI